MGVSMIFEIEPSSNPRGRNKNTIVLLALLPDPLGNNPTPPWGHLGQVDSCRTNLEVADPLAGSAPFEVEMSNGFTYHLQETAFFSWFYNQVPSLGISGWYSSGGTFTTPAEICQ